MHLFPFALPADELLPQDSDRDQQELQVEPVVLEPEEQVDAEDDFSPGVFFFQIPESVDDRTQRVVSVDDRDYLSLLREALSDKRDPSCSFRHHQSHLLPFIENHGPKAAKFWNRRATEPRPDTYFLFGLNARL